MRELSELFRIRVKTTKRLREGRWINTSSSVQRLLEVQTSKRKYDACFFFSYMGVNGARGCRGGRGKTICDNGNTALTLFRLFSIVYYFILDVRGKRFHVCSATPIIEVPISSTIAHDSATFKHLPRNFNFLLGRSIRCSILPPLYNFKSLYEFHIPFMTGQDSL